MYIFVLIACKYTICKVLILVKINQTELDERIEISRVGTLFTVYETEGEALNHL